MEDEYLKINPALPIATLEISKQYNRVISKVYDTAQDEIKNNTPVLVIDEKKVNNAIKLLYNNQNNKIISYMIDENGNILLRYEEYYVRINGSFDLINNKSLSSRYPELNNLILDVFDKSKKNTDNRNYKSNIKKLLEMINREKSKIFAGTVIMITGIAIAKYVDANVDFDNLFKDESNNTSFSTLDNVNDDKADKDVDNKISYSNNDLKNVVLNEQVNNINSKQINQTIEEQSQVVEEQAQVVDEKAVPEASVNDSEVKENNSDKLLPCDNIYSSDIYNKITKSDYSSYIYAYANYYGFDSNILVNMISQESNGDIYAKNGTCVGLGQLSANDWMGKEVFLISKNMNVAITQDNIMDPEIQISARSMDFKKNLEKYNGNLLMALHSGVGEGNMKNAINSYSSYSGISVDVIKNNPVYYDGFSNYYRSLEQNGRVVGSGNYDYAKKVLGRAEIGTTITTTSLDGDIYNYIVNENGVSISKINLDDEKNSSR